MKYKFKSEHFFYIILALMLFVHLAHIYMYGSSKEFFSNSESNSALPEGIPKSQIVPGTEDMYILKSEVVPPVCPKCPDIPKVSREHKCPPCKPCGRCPEPLFSCKKVPNYDRTQNNKLPLPMLNDFSSF